MDATLLIWELRLKKIAIALVPAWIFVAHIPSIFS